MNEKQLKWLLNSLKMKLVEINGNILLENVIYKGDSSGKSNDDGTEIIKWAKDFESLGDGLYTVSLDEGDNADYFLSLMNNTTGDYEEILLLNERVNEIFIIKGNQIEFEDKIYTVTRSTAESGEETIKVTETIKYLRTDNEVEYTPVSDYNPVTKKYLEDYSNTINTKLDSIIKSNSEVHCLRDDCGVLLDSTMEDAVIDYLTDRYCYEFEVENGTKIKYSDLNNSLKLLLEYMKNHISNDRNFLNIINDESTLISIDVDKYNTFLIRLSQPGTVVTIQGKFEENIEYGVYSFIELGQLNNMIKFNENGNLIVTIDGISKEFAPIETPPSVS